LNFIRGVCKIAESDCELVLPVFINSSAPTELIFMKLIFEVSKFV